MTRFHFQLKKCLISISICWSYPRFDSIITPSPLNLPGSWLRSFSLITESIYALGLHSLAAGAQPQASWVFLFILNAPSLYLLESPVNSWVELGIMAIQFWSTIQIWFSGFFSKQIYIWSKMPLYCPVMKEKPSFCVPFNASLIYEWQIKAKERSAFISLSFHWKCRWFFYCWINLSLQVSAILSVLDVKGMKRKRMEISLACMKARSNPKVLKTLGIMAFEKTR